MGDINSLFHETKDGIHQLTSLIKCVQFVLEHARVADQIGQVELAAAEAALSDRLLANDGRSQVWNAIGHLKSAYHATVKATEDIAKDHLRLVVFGESYEACVPAMLSRLQYILCLMIVSYSILEEAALCKKYIGQLQEAAKYGNTSSLARGAAKVIKWAGMIPVYGLVVAVPRRAHKALNKKCMEIIITPEQTRKFAQRMEEWLETRRSPKPSHPPELECFQRSAHLHAAA